MSRIEPGRRLLAGLKPLVPRLKKIWADGAYGGEKLTQWCQVQGGIRVAMIRLMLRRLARA